MHRISRHSSRTSLCCPTSCPHSTPRSVVAASRSSQHFRSHRPAAPRTLSGYVFSAVPLMLLACSPPPLTPTMTPCTCQTTITAATGIGSCAAALKTRWCGRGCWMACQRVSPAFARQDSWHGEPCMFQRVSHSHPLSCPSFNHRLFTSPFPFTCLYLIPTVLLRCP